MNIKIANKIDELTKEEWTFSYVTYLSDLKLILNYYSVSKKEKKTSKEYKPIKQYNRFNTRQSNMTEEEVPLNAAIREEVLERFMDSVEVVKFNELNDN